MSAHVAVRAGVQPCWRRLDAMRDALCCTPRTAPLTLVVCRIRVWPSPQPICPGLERRTATWTSHGPTWMSCHRQRYPVLAPNARADRSCPVFWFLTSPHHPRSSFLLFPPTSTLNNLLDLTSISHLTFFTPKPCEIAIFSPNFVGTTTSPCSGCQFGAQTEP